MTRMTVELPTPLKSRISRAARQRRMTVGQFVRQSLENAVAAPARSNKGTMFDLEVFKGKAPADVSANVDAYLYGAKRDLH
jgi:hypothetical protein